MRSLLGAVAVAITLGLALTSTGNAAEARKQHRIAIQVDQNDPAVMNLVLNNVENVAEYYNGQGEEVEIEVVAYGPGLNMVRDDKSPVKDRLKRIKEGSFPSTVKFSACGVTKRKMEEAEGHPVSIISEASVVPAGVVRLSELQEQGWSYIRP